MSTLIVESALTDLHARAQALDGQLREARRQQRRRNHCLATLLREMDDDRLHELLGYATLTGYAEAALACARARRATSSALAAPSTGSPRSRRP